MSDVIGSSPANLNEHGDGFYQSYHGRNFLVTHQTIATAITGQTSFATTTPTFLLYGAAVTKRAVLRSVALSQTGTVAGGAITIVVGVDTTDRFSSGGTAITPVNLNGQSSTASVYTFKYNATASDVAARYIWKEQIPAALSATWTFKPGSAAMIRATGSILIWTYASTTGPTWHVNFNFSEED